MKAHLPISRPIAVVCPAGPVNPERFQQGLQIASDMGFELEILGDRDEPFRYFAAPDSTRLAHLNHALSSPDYGAVWLGRGGYGLTRLLAQIDFAAIAPKPVIGFSDATALFAALLSNSDCPLIHGPVINSLSNTSSASLAHLQRLLSGQARHSLKGTMLLSGTATGPLMGGNLCLLATLCGSAFQPNTKGSIIVLEDIAEAPYRIDRMLVQLSMAGFFDGIAGVALGTFKGCEAPKDQDWNLLDVLKEHLSPLGVPVVTQLPIGHGSENFAFPWGVPATIEQGQLHWELS